MRENNTQTPEEKHIGLIDSIKLASSNDRKAAYILIFLFSASASILLGIPIMFKEPLIYCIDNNATKFVCSEVEACSGDFKYFIDKENGPKSFTSDFELICENSSGKRFALSLNFFGFFVGCLFITFFVVSPANRKKIISLTSFLYGASFIAMLFLSDSLFLISILLFAVAFCFVYVNAYIYVFITENFVGDLASSMMILVNLGLAIAGILFSIFAFFVNSNWKIFLGVSGILMVVGGIYFWFMAYEKNYATNQSQKSSGIMETFKNLYSQKQIFINFLVYSLIWPHYIVCYTSVLLEIESVGGNLYMNMVLCSTLEIVAALSASYLTKFNCGKVVQILVTCLSIFFLIFFFAPLSISKSSNYVIIFFIGTMLCGKVCYDIICLVVYIYLPKLLTDKYVPLFLIFSRFLSRLINLFIPYINFFFRSLNIHPFVFLGIVWLISRFLTTFTKEVQQDGIENILHDLKISLAHKLSVISGGGKSIIASIPHDEFLKNIYVKGQNLSVIKKSRFHSAAAFNSELGGITATLLQDSVINQYKEKYIEEERQ